MRFIRYLKHRLEERSTWASIAAGITAAATLVPPWAYVFVAVAVIGAMVPTGGGKEE